MCMKNTNFIGTNMKIKNLNKILILSSALLMQSMVNGADLATRLADPKTRLPTIIKEYNEILTGKKAGEQKPYKDEIIKRATNYLDTDIKKLQWLFNTLKTIDPKLAQDIYSLLYRQCLITYGKESFDGILTTLNQKSQLQPTSEDLMLTAYMPEIYEAIYAFDPNSKTEEADANYKNTILVEDPNYNATRLAALFTELKSMNLEFACALHSQLFSKCMIMDGRNPSYSIEMKLNILDRASQLQPSKENFTQQLYQLMELQRKMADGMADIGTYDIKENIAVIKLLLAKYKTMLDKKILDACHKAAIEKKQPEIAAVFEEAASNLVK